MDKAESTELERSALSMPLSALRFSGLGHVAAAAGAADDEGPATAEAAAILSFPPLTRGGADSFLDASDGAFLGAVGKSSRSRSSSRFLDSSSSSRWKEEEVFEIYSI